MTQKSSFLTLFIGALGIVYGDIGTSPLYALKSCFSISSLAITSFNIMGIISLFIWTLILITSIKYVAIVMRADDQGEGGILILSSLCRGLVRSYWRPVIVGMGIIGTTLFFGDGIITPAISVLSALEGLHLIHPLFQHYTIYMAIVVLISLFLIQKKGSGTIAHYCGPILLIWFAVISWLGLLHIVQAPSVLLAFNPWCALEFFIVNKQMGLLTMGGVILVVTGAEALYADMGHFGKKPIKWSWSLIVFPALVLNYLGQGALLLTTPQATDNPFYLLAPHNVQLPLIVLATLVTIIASQAVITGVFSMCWQAINLGYIPKLKVVHTSSHLIGQVYIPAINTLLCILTIIAVLMFKTSDNLAVAYGLNVSMLMMITSIFAAFYCHKQLKWSILRTGAVLLPVLIIEAIFVATNLTKLIQGAWFTILITLCTTYIIWVWRTGNKSLVLKQHHLNQSIPTFIAQQRKRYPHVIPTTAIFMTRLTNHLPASLVTHLKFNKFIHQKILILTILIEDKAVVRSAKQFTIHTVCTDTFQVIARYGFKETPNLNKLIHWAEHHGILNAADKPSFYVSKGIPTASKCTGMAQVNKKVFIFLARNSLTTYEYFKIPLSHMIELGVRYEI